MNYNMQGMTKTIPKLFAMLKLAEVEIKKEHQVLMIDKTTSFKKRQKEIKETSSRMTSKLSLPRRSPKLDQSLKLNDYTAKWTRVYLIYRLLMCALLVLIVAPEYFILVRFAKISNSKQELHNKQRLVEGKWRWVLEVVPRLIWSSSHTPYTFGISVKPK